MKLDYCFHSHTSRCGHAKGEDKQYVIEAINADIKTLGFSDHVFLPGKTQPGIRGNYEQLDDYITSVKTLKEKYKNQIDIYLGFECEYFDEYVDYYQTLLKEKGFDYLILGQHFFFDKDGSFFYVRNSIDEDNANRYINEITKALKTGLFAYFAHPDLILTIYESFNDKAEKTARTICELAKKYNTPLEINLNGMTWTLPNRLTYPCEDFWRIAGEIGNDVVIGYDSHYPEFYRETKYLDKALDFVEKYNLKLIKKDKIIQKFIKK